jgi:hypothetical protein
MFKLVENKAEMLANRNPVSKISNAVFNLFIRRAVER